MKYPQINIDLGKIYHNAKAVVHMCAEKDIEVWGVSKVFCGAPEVVRTLQQAGVSAIGESRLDNIIRLRKQGFDHLVLLRIPMLSEIEKMVEMVDICLVSEMVTLGKINEAAKNRGKRQKVLLMVDLGDLREGVYHQDAYDVYKKVKDLDNVHIVGLGTNLTCYGGVIPTSEMLTRLPRIRDQLVDTLGQPIPIISGGNSSSIRLLWQGEMPKGINNLRIGEAIVLGQEAVAKEPVPGTQQSTCIIVAEIVELQRKPSMPEGTIGRDAFGNVPRFEDRGIHLRAIAAIGRQDIDVGSLCPMVEGINVLGASSDHLLLEVDNSHNIRVGDVVCFKPEYGALLAAMTSPYVTKNWVE